MSVCVLLHVSTPVCACSPAWSCVWRKEDNFSESVLSCYFSPSCVFRSCWLRASGRFFWLCVPHCLPSLNSVLAKLLLKKPVKKLLALRHWQVQVPQAVHVHSHPQGSHWEISNFLFKHSFFQVVQLCFHNSTQSLYSGASWSSWGNLTSLSAV